jgi:dTDP-4-dehydrorhamnose reductase
MLKILVTGSNGQLGNEIQSLASSYPDLEITFTDVEELDITSLKEVNNFFTKHHFHALINCAGYTAVDKAEDEPELAMKVNGEAVQYLAAACIKHHCYPIHISTDYVFCGSHSKPYTEEDIPDPSSAYGKSKLIGERYFYDIAKKGLIIRTSWLYSPYGKNFIKTILQNGKTKNELKVVFDQVGSPTYARDLARHILQILPGALAAGEYGIYHYSNEGVSSWYDLALETVKLAGYDCKVVPVKSSEYPTKAPRPFYSLLDKSKIKKDFGITIPHWKESLEKCIIAMKE